MSEFATDPMAFFASLVIPSALGPRKYGEVMAPFQRERFGALAPALKASLRGERPTIGKFWFEGVKGLGKSSDAAYVALYALAFARVPQFIQLAAADADQASEPKRAAADVLLLNRWLADRISIQSSRMVCPATNSVAEVVAADLAGSHGARPTLLILDEVAHVAKFEFLQNLLDNSTKVPSCITLTLTNAGFTGTPAYRLREMARTSQRWHFDAVVEPPAWIPAAEIEEARQRNTPERFARLWQGVWSNQSGDALSSEDIQACITQPGAMPGKELGCDNSEWMFLAGLDLGIRHDRSAICVLAIHRQTRRRRLAYVKSWSPSKGGIFSKAKISLDAVKADILKIHASYSLRTVYFDPYQAILLAEQLQKEGLRMQEVAFVGANLNEMAAEVLESFNSRSLELYRCTELIEDLGRLTIVERNFGFKLESARDASGHADTATAFALALLAAKRTPIYQPFVMAVYGAAPDASYQAQQIHWGRGFLTDFVKGNEGPGPMRAGESFGQFIARSRATGPIVHGGERPQMIDDSRPGNRPGDPEPS